MGIEGQREYFEILLVEDNPGDQRLVKEALKFGTGRSRLHSVTDGSQALDFVFRRGKYSECPTPDLILLDLNMPTHGEVVLRQLQHAAGAKDIPIIVLTTSKFDREKKMAFELGAKGFITKPAMAEEFFAEIQAVERHWSMAQ